MSTHSSKDELYPIVEQLAYYAYANGTDEATQRTIDEAIAALEDFITQHTDRIVAEVIDTSKEVALTNNLPDMLYSEDYIRVREELREEMRQRYNKIKGDK